MTLYVIKIGTDTDLIKAYVNLKKNKLIDTYNPEIGVSSGDQLQLTIDIVALHNEASFDYLFLLLKNIKNKGLLVEELRIGKAHEPASFQPYHYSLFNCLKTDADTAIRRVYFQNLIFQLPYFDSPDLFDIGDKVEIEFEGCYAPENIIRDFEEKLGLETTYKIGRIRGNYFFGGGNSKAVKARGDLEKNYEAEAAKLIEMMNEDFLKEEKRRSPSLRS